MTIKTKYNILFRACDKVESTHLIERPFGLSKQDIIKVSFYSLYKSLSGHNFSITVIGDDLSKNLLDFFSSFRLVEIHNVNLGSASQSLKEQIKFAKTIPDDEWIYLCEDDYLHSPNCFDFIDEFIEHKKKYLATSWKKKNYVNWLIGNLATVPLIIHPPDYPDRYDPPWKRLSYIFRSKYCHWRQISNTTHTFLLKGSTFSKFYREIYESSHGPSDSKLSEKVYARFSFKNKALCVSPIKGLSTHLTNGVMTPFVDWEKLVEKYKREISNLRI